MTEFVLKSVTTLITNIYIFFWMKRVFDSKYKNPIIYVLSCIGITGIGIVVSNLNNAWGNLLYTILSIALTSIILYKGSIKTKIIFDVLYFFLVFMIDVVAVWIWVIIDGKRLDLILENESRMIISYVFNIVIMTVMWWLFMIIISKEKTITVKLREVVLQIIYVVFAFFVLYGYIEKASSSKDGIVLLVIILGFLLIDILLVVIMKGISKTYRVNYELEVMKYQNELQLEHYKELSDRYEESRKIIHDAKKHILVMENIKNSEECKEYSQNICREMDSLVPEFVCSNKIIAAILSAKLNECDKNEIKIRIDVKDGLYDYIKDVDLTGILANIWDNAIEESMLLNKDNRYIDFILGEKNGFCIIDLKNNYDSTTIKPRENHMGLGRTIVKEIVKSYNGLFDTNIERNIYEVRIMVPVCK